jgi:predicted RNase H-like HicB family nuclease
MRPFKESVLRFGYQLYAWRKLIFSFFKKNWELEDYPVWFQKQDFEGDGYPLWVANIVNWGGFFGFGNTQEEAFQDLKANFEKRRNEDEESIPRPGAKVKLQFSADDIVNSGPELKDDFIENILGFSPSDPVFISNKSSLLDFDEDIGYYFEKIKSVYGIDVSDDEDAIISEIIQRIEEED